MWLIFIHHVIDIYTSFDWYFFVLSAGNFVYYFAVQKHMDKAPVLGAIYLTSKARIKCDNCDGDDGDGSNEIV